MICNLFSQFELVISFRPNFNTIDCQRWLFRIISQESNLKVGLLNANNFWITKWYIVPEITTRFHLYRLSIHQFNANFRIRSTTSINSNAKSHYQRITLFLIKFKLQFQLPLTWFVNHSFVALIFEYSSRTSQ